MSQNQNSPASANRKAKKELKSGRTSRTARHADDSQRSLWRKPLVRIWSGVGILATAIIVAIGTSLGGRIFDSVTAPQPPHGSPIKIDSVTPMQPWHNYSYVLPYKLLLTPAQLAEMNTQTASSISAYQSWFRKKRGVPTDYGYIQVVISSNYQSPVAIREIDIVKNCQQPLKGTLFSNLQGSSGFPIPSISYNLDQNISVGQYEPPSGTDSPPAGGNFFAKEEITVSPHERPQTLTIFVGTDHQYCRFTFQMHMVTEKGEAVMNITNGGHPFQLTATGVGLRTTSPRFAIVYAAHSFTPPARFIREKPR